MDSLVYLDLPEHLVERAWMFIKENLERKVLLVFLA
jgi:hypothetical protein